MLEPCWCLFIHQLATELNQRGRGGDQSRIATLAQPADGDLERADAGDRSLCSRNQPSFSRAPVVAIPADWRQPVLWHVQEWSPHQAQNWSRRPGFAPYWPRQTRVRHLAEQCRAFRLHHFPSPHPAHTIHFMDSSCQPQLQMWPPSRSAAKYIQWWPVGGGQGCCSTRSRARRTCLQTNAAFRRSVPRK